MGACQSGEDTPQVCSLRAKGKEYLVIPLLPKYFPSATCTAFQEFYRLRGDPKIRYFYNRPRDDKCDGPGQAKPTLEESYTFSVTRQAEQVHLANCPLGCALAIVHSAESAARYSNCFDFLGKKIQVMGRLACRNSKPGAPWEIGVYLHHHFSEGQLKFFAVAAAAMYVMQSKGTLDDFRSVEFTTLQNNLSVLRYLLQLRDTVNRMASASGEGELRHTFEKRDNRFEVRVEQDEVCRLARTFAALVKTAPSDNESVLALKLVDTIPEVQEKASETLTQFFLDFPIVLRNCWTSKDFKIIEVLSGAPPAAATPASPLRMETLEDAVFVLSHIFAVLKSDRSSILPAGSTTPPEFTTVMYVGQRAPAVCESCHNPYAPVVSHSP